MTASSAIWSKSNYQRSVRRHYCLLPPTRIFRWHSSAPLITRRAVATAVKAHPLPPQVQPRLSHRRPFMSSSSSPASQSISEDEENWEDLSPEAKIQWLGDAKWGWVVYRCSYAKEFDGPWEDFKRRIHRLRESIAQSDAPGIAQTMDFVFVEDPVLEGASTEELQRRFQAWAREDDSSGLDLDDESKFMSRGSRYEFFVRVDGEALWAGHVGLVKGWPCTPGDEDWIKVWAGAVAPELYVQLSNPEQWYVYYRPPEFGVANAP